MKLSSQALLLFILFIYVLPVTASASRPKVDEYCKVDYFSKTNAGTYKGQCIDNTPYGPGIVEFYNGDMIEGYFKDGQLDGAATMTAANGNIYNGEVVNGRRHGKGTLVWARGSRYVGEWVDDKRHGDGIFTWSNGSRFEGEFRYNKRYSGMYYTNNGRVLKCRMGKCR